MALVCHCVPVLFLVRSLTIELESIYHPQLSTRNNYSAQLSVAFILTPDHVLPSFQATASILLFSPSKNYLTVRVEIFFIAVLDNVHIAKALWQNNRENVVQF